MNSGESMEMDLFPARLGGSIPTSPLQFTMQEVSKGIAAAVYKKYHYLGEKDFLSLFNYGALWEGEVWASITFAIPNAKNIAGLYSSNTQHGVLEISRLACKPECPKNTPSRLIAVATKMLQKKYPLRMLISYADTAQNHEGGIYKASNFKYHGLTDKKTDFRFPDGSIRKMKGVKYSELEGEWIPRSQKHLFSKQFKTRSNQ